MTILSNGHQWKYSEFLENKNYSFDKKQILNSLSEKEIDDYLQFKKIQVSVLHYKLETTYRNDKLHDEEEVWLDSFKISKGYFSDLGYRF